MINKIKQVLVFIKDHLVLFFSLLIAILVYILGLKTNKLDTLKAQLSMADTQKKADALEQQITEAMAQAKLNNQDITEHQNLLKELDKQRQMIDNSTPTDKDVEDTFNNKE